VNPVFFRDDDAGWADERLFALLDVFERRGVPLDVAAIPAALSPRVARELLARGVAVHQHGFAHVDHERAGRKCEFGPGRSREAQLRDLAAGRARLRDLLGDAVEPIFTPPWNRCTQQTADCLAELGFACLSRESRAAPLDGIAELPVHVDWLKRDGLAERLRDDGPVGIMLHHAVMDDADLRELDALLAHVGPRCVRMSDLQAVPA
jgi:hypothetical protein